VFYLKPEGVHLNKGQGRKRFQGNLVHAQKKNFKGKWAAQKRDNLPRGRVKKKKTGEKKESP